MGRKTVAQVVHALFRQQAIPQNGAGPSSSHRNCNLSEFVYGEKAARGGLFRTSEVIPALAPRLRTGTGDFGTRDFSGTGRWRPSQY
jgi:hypothetical protein